MAAKINTFFWIVILLCVSFTPLHAQDRLFELSVRASSLSSTGYYGGDNGYIGAGINTELLYFIKPKIGMGIFYTHTLTALSDSNFESGNAGLAGDFESQMYGLAVQATTDRARLFRVYGTVRLFKVELVHHYKDLNFSIGESGYGYSAGLGVTLKISNTLGFNLLEVNYVGLPGNSTYTKQFDEKSNNSGIQIQSGFLFKIRKRK